MAISDFRKAKKLKVTEVSGTPTISRTACLKITSGDDTTTGTGEIVLNWSNISSKADIGIYDESDNLLDYYFESFDATNETAVIWVYRSWVRDGTVQAKIAYGDGPNDQSVVASTVFSKETDLAAGYLFNEETGDLLDVSGNNNDGTVHGATRGADGVVGGAYSFDGNDDYLLVPDSSSLDLTREFSISAWIMHEDPDHTQNIVTKESAYEIAVDTDGTLKWAFYTAGGWEWHDTGVSVPANEWHHVIFSYNGDSTTVYLDGSSVSTIADPQGGPIDTNGNDVWVGAREGGGSGSAWFQGYIDEVRITSSAIGPQEASNLHQKGIKETWTDPDTGEPACVNGERVDHGGVSSGRRYIVQDGKIHFCKEPAQEDAPESFMSTFSECDSINAGGVTYYCGAGGTQQQGKWYSLPNSQCLEITSIRGTRIRTVN